MIETTPLRKKLLDLAISGKLVPKTGEWKVSKIGAIADVARGGSPRPIKDYLTDDPDGLNWIKIGDASAGSKYIVSVKERIRREGLRKTRQVVPGDLLLTNSMSFGHPYILQVEGCIHDGWLVLHPSGEIDKEYLYYVLMAPATMMVFRSLASGGVVSNLNSDKVASVEISYPPLAEQKAIVKRLEELLALEREIAADSAALDDLITAAKRKILDLAVSGKLVCQNAAFGSARELLSKATRPKKKPIDVSVVNPAKCPYVVPNEWTWCRAGDLGTMTRGAGIKRSETVSEGCPCLRYGEIYTSYDFRFASTRSYVPSALFATCKKICRGDLVFTLTGETKPDIAKTIAYEGEPPVAAGGDLAIWSGHMCNAIYLSYYMASSIARTQIASLATGDMVCHISAEKVGSLWLPLPPLAEQKAIVKRVEELFAVLDAMKEV